MSKELKETINIGVYFGAFDPIHTNHIHLCRDLLNRGFEKIYLVPNESNNMKPYMVSKEHRLNMIEKLIVELKLDGGLIAYNSTFGQSNWEGRFRVCDEIQKKHSQTQENTKSQFQIYQIVGQDSYEKSLTRCHRNQGIYSVNQHKLLVYPRLGCSQEIKIPRDLNNRVEVMRDYKDPQNCSSTLIRDLFKTQDPQFENFKNALGKSTFDYINENKLYSPLKNNKHIIVFLGPPGSGKGSICQELIKNKKYCEYIHISTGDLYRIAESNRTPEYFELVNAKKQGQSQYMESLNKFITGQLKKIVNPDKYYLIDGLKPNDIYVFEREIAPVDSLVILNCSSKCAEDRLKARGLNSNRKDDELSSIRKRVSNYFYFQWIQKEFVESYQGTGRPVFNLNCEKNLQSLCSLADWEKLLYSFS